MKNVFAAIGAVVSAIAISQLLRIGLPAAGFERETGAFWSGYAMGIMGGAYLYHRITS